MALSPKQIAVKAILPLLNTLISDAKNDVEKHITGRGNKVVKSEKAKEQVDKICAPFVQKMNNLSKRFTSVAEQIEAADKADDADF